MADTKGFIKCTDNGCGEIAEVRQASGKRSSLYTVCPSCGTNQANGVSRQSYLADNLKASRDDVEIKPVIDTEEKPAIPSKDVASGDIENNDFIPEKKPKPIPKDMPSAPPALLTIAALFIAILSAFFATRKPKGQTA